MGSSPPLEINTLNTTRELVLNWYRENRRDLPWRSSRDPYIIWVSEIIFQQTRIEQGLNYYTRFVERFPNIESLAQASEQEVLTQWQGLGYYNRAKNLHQTARRIYFDFEGVFPSTFEALLDLKGIGDYTASMIASVCYESPSAAVDGNVYRVLSRLNNDATAIDTNLGKKHFKQLAQQLLDPQFPGDFNQGLMELGALICKPKDPQCHSCPVQSHCRALANHSQTHLPIKSPKKPVSALHMNYLFIHHSDGFYIQQRPRTGIWPGMWELVRGERRGY